MLWGRMPHPPWAAAHGAPLVLFMRTAYTVHANLHTSACMPLACPQAAAARQLGALEAQLECRRVHAAHAAALAAAAERDVADIRAQIAELHAEIGVRLCALYALCCLCTATFDSAVCRAKDPRATCRAICVCAPTLLTSLSSLFSLECAHSSCCPYDPLVCSTHPPSSQPAYRLITAHQP